MKKILLVLIVLAGFALNSFAQSDVKLRHEGADSADLQSLIHFEGINIERLSFKGSDLKNKDYQIIIKKFVNGNLAQTDVAFDSRESVYTKGDAFFRIKTDQLTFRILAQAGLDNTVKYEFQFDRYSQSKEYQVATNQKAFVLRNFLGGQLEQSISLTKDNHLAIFMLPYVKENGASAYREVTQSGVNPEELGKEYPIPLYFLIDIKFL